MGNVVDNKSQETALKTLPDNQLLFVNEMIAKGKVGEITFTPIETIEGPQFENLALSGEPEFVYFAGYPFLTATRSKDMDGHKVITPILRDLGLNLTALYWDNERQAFACVRNDVYAA